MDASDRDYSDIVCHLRAIAASFTEDGEMIQDIVQDAALKVLTQKRPVTASLLFRIVRSCAIDLFRDRVRYKKLLLRFASLAK